MYKKILFVPKIGGANVDKAHIIIDRAKEYLADYHEDNEYGFLWRKIQIIESYDDADHETLLVPVGGDGTVLFAAKAALAYDLPIIGINLGQVGFLTDLTATDQAIEDLFFAMVQHQVPGFADGISAFKEDHRTLLSVEFNGSEYVAMNDFVISDLYADSIINYDLKVGTSAAGTHRANSVIIATPTGSTAYALMVGGSIIEPDLDVMEIIPVAPLTMASRPIIVGGSSTIEIKIHNKKNREVSLKSDGQEIARLRGDDATITIKRHNKKVKLLHYKKWNYFEKLSLKLGWNK